MKDWITFVGVGMVIGFIIYTFVSYMAGSFNQKMKIKGCTYGKCRICALGGRWAIGCVGAVFVTPYPKWRKVEKGTQAERWERFNQTMKKSVSKSDLLMFIKMTILGLMANPNYPGLGLELEKTFKERFGVEVKDVVLENQKI